jgi:hypothetical protein
MKHLLIFGAFICCMFQISAQNSQRSEPGGISLFETETAQVMSDIVTEGSIMTLKQKVLEEILSEQPKQMTLRIPAPDGNGEWVLLLRKNEVLSDDIIIQTSDGRQLMRSETQSQAAHYRGEIRGIDASVLAISFFSGELMGVISNGQSNYDLGLLENDPLGRYVLYKANDIYQKLPFNCDPMSVDDANGDGAEQRVGGLTCGKAGFRMYYECDYQMYLDRGSNATNVVNYVTGLHNVVNVLYNNEGLNSTISEIFVWTAADPYRTLTSSSSYLTNFRSTRTSFNGNLAHLLSTRNTNFGGIAYLDVLCSSANRYAFSNISNSYAQFPTYSWSVMVVTHEIGHNLGSPHTQSCTWPGGAIDNCYPTEGGCPQGPAPVNGGTIMSYCHLAAYGINLSNGFGPLPGNLIRNRTLNAPCLDLLPGSQTIALGCIPTTTNPFNTTGIGPVQVQLNNIDFASPSANIGVFSDYSCTVGDTLTEGATYTIRVLTSGGNRQNVRAYIDYNGDNVFGSGELVLSSNGATTGNVWHQATFSIPTTAVKNTPIRMRVLSEFSATSNPLPCGSLPYGQAEDYALFIVGSASLSTGSLSASSACSGATIDVPYTATGTFNAGNIFTAQLSNASGDFSSPVTIGTLTSTASGTINATIPAGTSTGSGYRVRVISSNPSLTGSTSSTVLSITGSATPSVSIAITGGGTNSICAGTSVTFTASATNGGLSPSYQWRINGTNTGSNSPTFTSSTLANGQVVTCVLTSNAACASPQTASSNGITMTVNAIPNATISGGGTICSGASATLTASGGAAYAWNTGATTASITVSPGSSATYSVTVSSSAGCSAQASATVTVNQTITPTFNAIAPFCSGSAAPVLPLVSNNGITGTWSPSVVSNTASGTYVFSANAGQCATSASLTANVLPVPVASISGNLFICPGQSTLLTAVGGTSYLWSNGATTATISVSPETSTSYQVSVQNSQGCSASNTATVTVNNGSGATPPTPPAISGKATVCDGSLGELYSIAPVANAVSYNWELTNGTIVSGQGSTQVSINFPTVYTSTILKVQAVNECGVAGAFRSLTIRAPAKSATPGLISGPTEVCVNAAAVPYSIVPASNAVSYNWSISGGSITPAGDGTTAFASFPASYSTVAIEVRGVNVCGIISSARILSVRQPAVLTPGVISGNLAACAGATDERYSIVPIAGATTYLWQTSVGTISGSNSGSEISVNFPESYSSMVISVQSINVCGTVSSARTITVKPPAKTVTPGIISGSAVLCPGTIESYSISPVNNATGYFWEATGGVLLGAVTGTSVQLEAPASYSSIALRVYSVNSCGVRSSARSLSVKPPAVVKPGNITGPTLEVCGGSSGLTYTVAPVAGAVSYNWIASNGTIATGQGTNIITLNAPESYVSFTLKVHSINECGVASSASNVLTIRSVPATPASITGPGEVCAGATLSYTASAALGATGYQWTMPTGWTILSGQGTANVSILAGASNGTLRVAATNKCGSSASRSRAIAVIPCLVSMPDSEDPVSVKPGTGKLLNIFPNPASDKVIIIGEDIREVQLMDIRGSLISARRYQTEQKVELDLNYPAGIYLIRIAGEGWTEVRKLLIQR